VLNDFRYGMKWAATDNIALKLEVQYLKTNDEAEVVRGYRAAHAQCSFAF
jgi:opacity protein-like surface antigen